MRSFDYVAPVSLSDVLAMARSDAPNATESPIQFMGGGTTLLDLMKLDVMRPRKVLDIRRIDDGPLRRVERTPAGLRIGALVSMRELSDRPDVARDYPLLRDALWQAASPQLRNMARLGGNVLQRTRCPYFRDTSYDSCNKRQPGSGCAALDGFDRLHAVLGTSESCIATYAGDWAQPLIALDAEVEIAGAAGERRIAFADLHRRPGDTPHIETTLAPGELITAFVVPGPARPRSLYLKIRDRQSYAFANASAAVALDLRQGVVDEVRIALGGVATVPWRAREAESVLRGERLTEALAARAAEAEFAAARPRRHNAFKVPLGRATLVRALLDAQAMQVRS